MKNIDTLDGPDLSRSVSILTPLVIMGNFSMVCCTFRETKLYAAINIIINIKVCIYRKKNKFRTYLYYAERYLTKTQLLLG